MGRNELETFPIFILEKRLPIEQQARVTMRPTGKQQGAKLSRTIVPHFEVGTVCAFSRLWLRTVRNARPKPINNTNTYQHMTIPSFNNSLFVNNHNGSEAAPLVLKRIAMTLSKSRFPYNGACILDNSRPGKTPIVWKVDITAGRPYEPGYLYATELPPKSHCPVTTSDAAEHIIVPQPNCLRPTETQLPLITCANA